MRKEFNMRSAAIWIIQWGSVITHADGFVRHNFPYVLREVGQ